MIGLATITGALFVGALIALASLGLAWATEVLVVAAVLVGLLAYGAMSRRQPGSSR